MKKIRNLICVVAIATTFSIGCTTVTAPDGTTTKQFDPAKTVAVMHRVVPPAVKYAITQYPESRKYITDVQLSVCALVGSSNVTPEALKAAFDGTGINDLKAPDIQAASSLAYGVYAVYYDDLIASHLPKTTVFTNLTVVLTGICESLTEGLAQ